MGGPLQHELAVGYVGGRVPNDIKEKEIRGLPGRGPVTALAVAGELHGDCIGRGGLVPDAPRVPGGYLIIDGLGKNMKRTGRRDASSGHGVHGRDRIGVVSINNCLPAGPISQPSLVSQIAGIYDDNMELNENVYFWKAGIPTSLPVQMRRLGYRSVFWYGGGLNWGSLEHFIPAIGFDDCHGGPDICPDDAPRTWLGVYDHIFLQNAERLIKQSDDGQPVLHFLYTTSNHGPYRMPMEELGFDAERILADAPDEVRNLRGIAYRQLGGIWYADQSLIHFAERMMEAYPDSLIIVTGDHAGGLPPYGHGVIPREEATLRELRMPSFALYHRDLTWDMLAHNDLASHMAIMPTVMELIAPEGFEYLSISRPLTEHIDHVVTPYCWMDDERIGDYGTRSAQQLAPSLDPVPMENDIEKYRDERNALAELTGWVLRHPELLVTYR